MVSIGTKIGDFEWPGMA